MTAKCVGKFGHIGDDIIYSESIQGMGIGENHGPHQLRAPIAAPHIRVAEEEALQVSDAAFAFGIQIQTLLFKVRFQRRQC